MTYHTYRHSGKPHAHLNLAIKIRNNNDRRINYDEHAIASTYPFNRNSLNNIMEMKALYKSYKAVMNTFKDLQKAVTECMTNIEDSNEDW